MNESTLFNTVIKDNDKHIIGYSVVKKTHCEIYNFVSPTLRILRFTEGSADWKIDHYIQCFQKGDIVVLSNLNKRNIHKLHTDYITYEIFDFYPSFLSNEKLWSVFYQSIHKTIGADDTNAPKFNFLLNCLKEEIITKKDSFQLFAVQSLLDLLALELKRSIEQTEELHYSSSLFHISQSVQYIAEHFYTELSVSDLANMCSYSPEHYSRLFKKYLGVSPIQYIINLRLENAVHLINTEKMTVMDAAYKSGFQSSSAFYKAFHAYRNSVPGKARISL